MNIKKLFFSAKGIFVLLLVVAITSCSKKSQDNPAPTGDAKVTALTAGQWTILTLELKDDNGNWNVQTIDPFFQSYLPFQHVTFNPNGTIAVSGYGSYTDTGSWSFGSGDATITVKPSQQASQTADVVAVNSSTFEMSWTTNTSFTDNGKTFHVTGIRETFGH
ncbi:MAG: hypothetical protein JWM92_203 [Candidatus Nomurabacteria bacterium]|jgi:hypothetical protein|nr:hypothetical protein [Candidatus Nomurabacteria bacterium]